MARGKVRFTGRGLLLARGKALERSPAFSFSESVRGNIRELYPGENAEPDAEDYFVDDIEREVSWASFFLENAADRGSFRQEVSAELGNLLKRSESLRDDFRRLSPFVGQLWPPGSEPSEHADNLDRACNDLKKVYALAKTLPGKMNARQHNHKIAVELAIRILRVAKQAGMKISATSDTEMGYTSDAVKLLSYAGEDIGLNMGPDAWKKSIRTAREKAPDLK